MNDSTPANSVSRPELRWVSIAAIAIVLLGSLPYAIAALTTPPDARFGGVLVNPLDGHSYLAKLRQGADGAWLFRLPYTAPDDPDALLFTYHLALGHVARWTGLPPIVAYHAARLAGGWFLLVTLYVFSARVFDAIADRRRAWWFLALSAGLGWIVPSASDLNIPESNTFFSILANAHFAAATALMLVTYLAVVDGRPMRAACAAIGLAILQPFAPVVVFAAMLGGWVVGWLVRREWPERPQRLSAVVAGLALIPLMLYFYFATQRDPILQQWSAQNLTPSPPPMDFVLGYGVMGLLAIPGARAALKRGRAADGLLVGWLVANVLLLYAPFPLQRRLSLGLHVPIVLLGLLGLMQGLPLVLQTRAARWLTRVAFAVSLPSTLLLLLATSSATLMRPLDGRLFVTANEAAAFDWLGAHAPRDAVVLAAPEIGLWLPGWAGVRVVYGHPFETIDAVRTRARVEQFFSNAGDRASLIREYGVDFVFFGPRERALGVPGVGWVAAFASGDVVVYRVP